MRHVILTCKNHPELRWSTKGCAFSDEGGYNGSRNIFFKGTPTGEGMYSDGSGLNCSQLIKKEDGTMETVHECSCSSRDLVRAPEDELVKR